MTNIQRNLPFPTSEGADFIRDAYRDLLRRTPDEPGQEAHLRALENGTTPERLYYEIRVSPEGCRAGVPVEGLRIGTIRAKDLLRQDGFNFVDAVYLALLGRTPSEREAAANLETLSKGVSRETVITSVLASPEATSFGTAVTGLTQARLIRKAKDTVRRIPGAAKAIDAHRQRRAVKPIEEKPKKIPLSKRLRMSCGNLLRINRLALRVDQLERNQALNELRVEVESLRGELRLQQALRESESRFDGSIAYKQFEDEMRGSRDEIIGRLRSYDDVIARVRERCGDGLFALDLGCGRGEWLEMMQKDGIDALGVDSDPGMIRDCEARGLMTVQADLLTYLRNTMSASADIVTLFQVAEHLPVNTLTDALCECHRVLRPGGALIVETPNPENLIVGACNFYLDPTHVTKLPPALLQILVRGSGFEEVGIRRLHAYNAIDPEKLEGAPEALRDAAGFLNQCADYAVTAFKAV